MGKWVNEMKSIKNVLFGVLVGVVALMFYQQGDLGIVKFSTPEPPVVLVPQTNEVYPTVEPTVEPLVPTAQATATPVIAPTADTSVIIITDTSGYPVYVGPLNQDQYNQCKTISDNGDFYRLVEYQKPLCLAALGN